MLDTILISSTGAGEGDLLTGGDLYAVSLISSSYDFKVQILFMGNLGATLAPAKVLVLSLSKCVYELLLMQTVFENSLMQHHVALPPNSMGKVTYVAPAGQYSLKVSLFWSCPFDKHYCNDMLSLQGKRA